MIIKSMSRKAPSFSQLIDYIEAEAKTGTQARANHRFSVFHNTQRQTNSDHLKEQFKENAQYLRERKNGVYLYHEVLSIKRSHRISEDQQKEALQAIVREYLNQRASRHLAYAVLHEDKADNLHFHIIISSNEIESDQRKRLSKADFATIQTQLEKWTIETFPELDQQAVFSANQTQEQKAEKQRKARISNSGAELKRRGGKTTERDRMKETIEKIFSTATNGRVFSDLLEKAGLQFYTRGKNHGIIDQDGTKYRFSTLGLAEVWEALDRRMTEALNGQKPKTEDRTQDTKDTNQDTPPNHKQHEPPPAPDHHDTQANDQPHQETTTQSPVDRIAEEAQRRLDQITKRREEQAKRQQEKQTKHRPQQKP